MRRRKHKLGTYILELLEIRKLLSVVNIQDFGAVPNDNQNDSGAVIAAMNSAKNGDTIFFPRGTYNIDNAIMLKGNLTYVGDNGTTLLGAQGQHIFHVQQDNTDIEDFTFVGMPIMVDTPDGSMVQNLTINGNEFQTQADGSDDNANGITFTTGLKNSSITNNSFGPIDGDNGIYGYYWDNLNIANNEFLNGNEGIHLTDFNNVSQNLTIQQNYFSGLHRMGIELQGGGNHSVIQDNYYENPNISPNFSDNMSTFAYSIIADESENNVVQRNTIVTLDRPDGTGVRIGIEIGGTNTLVQENYIDGTNNVLSSNDFNGPTSVTVKDNRWMNYLIGPAGRNVTLIHNGANVDLDWDPTRGKPGPFKVLSATGVTHVPKSTDELVQDIWQQLGEVPVPLSQLQPVSTGQIQPSDDIQANADDSPMTIDGNVFNDGLRVGDNSNLVYNLGGKYSQLFSVIGIDDSAPSNAAADFQVFADGKEIYESGLMSGKTVKRKINLNVAGVQQLTLTTSTPSASIPGEFADWSAIELLPANSAG